MKVKCVSTVYISYVYNFITIGKEYEVVNELITCYELTNDEGYIIAYEKELFEVVEEEPVKPAFTNMKFRVRDEEHSKQIQEALFELGYGWSNSLCKNIKHLPYEFLFSNVNGEIMVGAEYSVFRNYLGEEYELQFKPIIVKKEIKFVEVSGYKVREDDLLEFLKDKGEKQ